MNLPFSVVFRNVTHPDDSIDRPPDLEEQAHLEELGKELRKVIDTNQYIVLVTCLLLFLLSGFYGYIPFESRISMFIVLFLGFYYLAFLD